MRRFNPRPSRRTGDTYDAIDSDRSFAVSIRARPEGRAIPSFFTGASTFSQFQSAPVPKDGRYLRSSPGQARSPSFNPRPSRRTGDTCCSRRALMMRAGFNPRPSRRTGDTTYQASSAGRQTVSIRARPEGRAIRRCAPPAAAAGGFQSAPVPKDGRYRGRLLCRLTVSSFNPRPSRRTGDTGRRTTHSPRSKVSIRARPEGRAIPRIYREPARDSGVSIRARPEGRAIRDPIFPFDIISRVSIRARPEGRAIPPLCRALFKEIFLPLFSRTGRKWI